MGRRRKKIPTNAVTVRIESSNNMSHDGRAVVRINDKTTFIHGALPGELIEFQYTSQKKRHDEGRILRVIEASDVRVEPGCRHFEICGGCSLQHIHPDYQIQIKQKALLDALQHIGKLAAEDILPPLVNQSPWGYRRKARLGVKYVIKKERVLVGFRERGSNLIADLESCQVLHPKVGHLLSPLAHLIEGLTLRQSIPQIEVAMDDHQCVLILRVLNTPDEEDRDRLRQFAADHDLSIYLQPGGVDSVEPLEQAIELAYELTDFDLRLCFLPTDFTQVNTEMNQQMIGLATRLLELSPQDQVLDLFCGIGNFTLPMATLANRVTGVEGDVGLVERARANAGINRLDNAEFFQADLYAGLQDQPWMQSAYNKVLLDPPRSGAAEILPYLARLSPEKILYVSCFPGTLARDAGQLVHDHGYRLTKTGVMDMFPHTAHVESIALFEK